MKGANGYQEKKNGIKKKKKKYISFDNLSTKVMIEV